MTRTILNVKTCLRVALATFACVLCTLDLVAQERVITTGVPFLLITPDARGAAMGEQGVATSVDAFSQQWNPAKYVFSEQKSGFGVSYTPYLSKLVRHDTTLYTTVSHTACH